MSVNICKGHTMALWHQAVCSAQRMPCSPGVAEDKEVRDQSGGQMKALEDSDLSAF